MCHNSDLQKIQIERFVKNGMPLKIVKTIKHTLKKRIHESKNELKCSDEFSVGHRVCNTLNDNETCSIITLTELNPAIISKEMHTQSNVHTSRSTSTFETFQQLQDISADKNSLLPPSLEDESINNKNNEAVYEDILAKGTELTKLLVQYMNRSIIKLQSTKIYEIFTKTTQPAHVIAIGILTFVLLMVGPNITDNRSKTKAVHTSSPDINATDNKNITVIVLYLGAFATHFGAQIWMTFVSGLSLYFSLPRHTFGQCQQILFPKYFALNSMLSIAMLITYAKCFVNDWNIPNCVQLAALFITAVIEVTIRLYLAPPLLRLMKEKYKIEDAVGSGQEIGSIVQRDLVQCPYYQRTHKYFRRIHMAVATGNIAVLLTTCLHLYFIASKIKFG